MSLILCLSAAGCLEQVETNPQAYACLSANNCKPLPNSDGDPLPNSDGDPLPNSDSDGDPLPNSDGDPLPNSDGDTAEQAETAGGDATDAGAEPDGGAETETVALQDADTALVETAVATSDGDGADEAIADAAPIDSSIAPAGDATASDSQTACPTSCDDGNPCTEDTCQNGLCTQKPLTGGGCTDGDQCTSSDTCSKGACSGQKAVCKAASGCLGVGVCNPASGVCSAPLAADGTPCSDGNGCTVDDACQFGVCLATAVTDCDDGNPCSLDTCDPQKGCIKVTQADGAVCASSTCSANVWSQNSLCKSGVCPAAVIKSCGDGNLCTDDKCDAAAGCSNSVGQVTTCSDGNPCTTTDTCSSGVCKAGSGSLACDDGNVCTDDSCTAAKGCTATAKSYGGISCSGQVYSGHCYEAFKISGGYTAMLSKCVALGGQLATIHSATEDAKVFAIATKVCGTAASGAFFGLKQAVAATNGSEAWLDGSPLTYTSWSSGEPNSASELYGGLWLNSGLWSDFGEPGDNACAVCERLLGTTCNDGSVCSQGDLCIGGTCAGAPLACDDKNSCTTDSCDPKLGCQFKGVADGVACTAAICSGLNYATAASCQTAVCKQVNPQTCDDGIACTKDTCDATKGCSAVSYTCTDKNPCTDDVCIGGGSCSFAAKDSGAKSCAGSMWRGHCYEGFSESGLTVAAKQSFCTSKGGKVATIHSADENEIVRQALDAGCQNSSSTSGYIGLVQAGLTHASGHKWLDNSPMSYLNWNDGEPSQDAEVDTVMSRASGKWSDQIVDAGVDCFGCERIPGTPCNDNNLCTLDDVCYYSGCTGAPQSCDDGIVCTLDQCSATAGCTNTSGKASKQFGPLFCDKPQSKGCTTAGTCENSSASCGTKNCGYDGNVGDCGKCDIKSVCTQSGLCAAKSGYALTDKVLVSGGTFSMGCTQWNNTLCEKDTILRHIAYVSSFYLDTFEVSQGKFKACVTAGKCTAPAGGYDSSNDASPMVKPTWTMASAYCSFAGGDLPTESQWEFAARTIDGGVATTVYAWGNSWPPPNLAAIGNTGIAELADPYPYYHDANKCNEINTLGVCNMAGNISEWVRDYYTPDGFPTTLTVKDPVINTSIQTTNRVFRGSNWYYSDISEPAPYRRFSYDPAATYTTIGMRCAYPFVN